MTKSYIPITFLSLVFGAAFLLSAIIGMGGDFVEVGLTLLGISALSYILELVQRRGMEKRREDNPQKKLGEHSDE